MIIFLYGQDSYRISQKLQEIINGYKKKNPSGFNFFSFDLSEGHLEKLKDGLANTSLILEKKLILIKNILKDNPESVLEIFKSQNVAKRDDIIIIVVYFSDKDGSELFKYLIKKPNQAQNFELLKEYEVKNYAKKLLSLSSVDLTGEALDFLVSNCNYNLWLIDSEVKKLASFSAKNVVSKSQVEELMVSSANRNIFELTDALARKNKKKALLALYKNLENGENPAELLGLLAWQARNILNFKVSPDSLKLHPFVLSKVKESASLFSTDELNKILLKIIDLDLAFKTSQLNEKTAISLLLSEL